jgi:hypothetical protein
MYFHFVFLDRNAEAKRKMEQSEHLHNDLIAPEDKENFGRFMRFGMVDASILLMSLVAGVSFDGVIGRFIGVQGYGAIVGAGLGNCLADIIAGLPEGLYGAVGVGLGSILPLLPILIPMLMKKQLTKNISMAFGLSSLGFCIMAFVWGYDHREKEKLKHSDPEKEQLIEDVEELIRRDDYLTAISLLKEKQ